MIVSLYCFRLRHKEEGEDDGAVACSHQVFSFFAVGSTIIGLLQLCKSSILCWLYAAFFIVSTADIFPLNDSLKSSAQEPKTLFLTWKKCWLHDEQNELETRYERLFCHRTILITQIYGLKKLFNCIN